MKIIKVKNLKEAVISASLFLPKDNALNNFIALTGGRFGNHFLEHIKSKELNIGSWLIYQTDERVLCHKRDVIQNNIVSSLCNCQGFSLENLNFFSYEKDYLKRLQILEKKTEQMPDRSLDLCFLSLGQDGHLAGHFENSEILGNKFCVTIDAPKKPKTRVSYSVSWLKKSKKIVLVCIGKEKEKVLNDLISGTGLHSEIMENNNLYIITNN